MARLYPVYVDLAGREVLVVGGGPVAARKVRGLADTGARVTVLAPETCPELDRAAEEADAEVLRRAWRPGDAEGWWLVIAATDDPEVNSRVAEEARGARALCNVADRPELCSFHVPAVLRRGLLQMAVSTGGASPALAARIRRQLEEQYGESYAPLLEGLMDLRRHFQQRHPDEPQRRRRLLASFLDSEAPDRLLREGDREAFAEAVRRWRSR